MKVVFCCYTIVLINFVGTANISFVLLCACKDVSEHRSMVHYQKIYTVVKTCHEKIVNQLNHLTFRGRLAKLATVFICD